MEMLEMMSEEFFKELHESRQAICPCCKRRAALAPYKIHSTIASMLCRLYWASMQKHGHAEGWIHVEKFKPTERTGMDFSIVKHWGLAEPKSAKSGDDKRSSGYWRLKEKGSLFVAGKLMIESTVFVFNGKPVDWSEQKVDIKQCLGKKFSYDEIKSYYY